MESKPARPTEDQIRQRAYELYLARGDGPGDALNDWVRAERELRERFASPGGGPGAGVRPRPRSRSAAP